MINRVARIHRTEQTLRINNRLASRLHRSIALIHLKHGRAQHRVATLHQGRNQTRKTSRLRQIIRISTSHQLIGARLQTGVQRLRQTNILSQLHHLNRRAIQILGALNPAVHHGIQLGGQWTVLHQNQLGRTHRLVQKIRLQRLIQIGGVLLRVHAHQHRKIGYGAHATARLLRISVTFNGCRHAVAAGESQRVNALKHLSIRARRTQTITHTIEEIPQVGSAVISTQNSRNPQARRRATVEQLLQRVQGTRTGKDPQLIAHIVIETRPRVSVRCTKSLRVVLSHRRRHRNAVTVMNQTSRKLEVIIPNEELSNRQTTITANSLRIHQNRHERGATNRAGTHSLRTSMTLLTRRKHRARSVHRVVLAVRPHHTRCHHRGALRRHRRIVQPGGNRLRQGILGWLGVIIHNPHQVRVVAFQGTVNAHRKAASTTHVLLQADAIHRQLIVQGAQILGGAIRGGVINNHHRRRHALTRSDTSQGLR